jgi:putative RecB family exonuclease
VDEPAAGAEAAVRAEAGPSLSPSRAADFMTCPLLYRFRVIDRLPEPPSEATARGTLVHAVLDRLFDLPAAERTPQAARAMLGPQWQRLAAAEPGLAALFGGEAELSGWLRSAAAVVDAYFALEDPRRLEPAERECYVETVLASGLRLRGYIDRLDVAPGGAIRIVDYKTGRAPREAYEASALFQMKFYALVVWRLRGQVPRLLQLMYLAEGQVLRYVPDESDLLATERKVAALWQAIERAAAAGDWRPRPGRLCDWCSHKALCPAFGGTPPPLPDAAAPAGPCAAPAVPEALPEPSLPLPPARGSTMTSARSRLSVSPTARTFITRDASPSARRYLGAGATASGDAVAAQDVGDVGQVIVVCAAALAGLGRGGGRLPPGELAAR